MGDRSGPPDSAEGRGRRWLPPLREVVAGSKADQLVQDAWDHCITPLVAVEEIREAGLAVFARGEGVQPDRRRRQDLPRHDVARTPAPTRSATATPRSPTRSASSCATLHYVGTVNNFAPPTIRLATKIAELAPGPAVRRSSSSAAARRRSRRRSSSPSSTSPARRQAARPQDHLPLERLPRRDDGRPGRDRLARHPPRHRSRACPATPSSPGRATTATRSAWRRRRTPTSAPTYLERQIQHEGPEYVAAFIAEPVMQAHGVQIPPASYFQRVREICDKLRRALDRRRGHHRLRPHRRLVRDRALRRRAGHHDLGQGDDRRLHADGRGDHHAPRSPTPCRSSATSTPSAATPAPPPPPTR